MSAQRHLEHDWFPEPLPANVELGPGSWLYSTFAFRHYRSARPVGLRVGHDSGIYNGTFFDLGPRAEVRVGDYCSIVGAIFATSGRVFVGDYVFIAHEVVIGDHFAAAPPDVPCRHSADDAPADVIIGDAAWIGARAILLAGARIGAGAIVGAGAVVDGDVPPATVVAGNPATVVRSI
jgi:acetyltransferase-like isoleucine patch superfamily enzyme